VFLTFVLLGSVTILSSFIFPSSFADGFAKDPQVANEKGSVLATSTLTISADYDGDVSSSPSCNTTDTALWLEGGSAYRAYIRFPLTALPSGVTITRVTYRHRVTTANSTLSD